MNQAVRHFVDIMEQNGKKDVSVYSDSFLEKTLARRMLELSFYSLANYLDHLACESGEIEHILDSFHISHSLFFRNPLDMAIVERFVFPELFLRKDGPDPAAVRIWSAGCAGGQEPYSLLILAESLIKERFQDRTVIIFGTDISRKALEEARQGEYGPDAVQNVRLALMRNYFAKTASGYEVNDGIKRKVDFSFYDLLDSSSATPPGSIYGGFDLIACCNVMIYYKPEIQKRICDKLYHALADKGCLVVDESERSIIDAFGGLRLFTPLGNIFVKE